MRLALHTLVLCAAFAGGAFGSDFETLQGNWKRILGVRDGKPLTGAALEAQFTIEGNRFTITEGETKASGTLELNEGARPKTIDLKIEEGPNQGQTVLGIYEIRAGNRHRACFAPPGAPRPAKFESRAGSGHILEEMQRVQ